VTPDPLPRISIRRGGIQFPQDVAGADPQSWDTEAELVGLPGPALPPLVAAGGFCAPASSWYDLVDRTPWTHADLPLFWDVDVDEWLFPRLTSARRALVEGRRRLRLAVAALRGPEVVEVDPEDDEW
jgi:hypothetical protein